jgi:hypothetical protein
VAGDGWSSDKSAHQVDCAALIHPTLIRLPSPLFSGLFFAGIMQRLRLPVKPNGAWFKNIWWMTVKMACLIHPSMGYGVSVVLVDCAALIHPTWATCLLFRGWWKRSGGLRYAYPPYGILCGIGYL